MVTCMFGVDLAGVQWVTLLDLLAHKASQDLLVLLDLLAALDPLGHKARKALQGHKALPDLLAQADLLDLLALQAVQDHKALQDLWAKPDHKVQLDLLDPLATQDPLVPLDHKVSPDQ